MLTCVSMTSGDRGRRVTINSGWYNSSVRGAGGFGSGGGGYSGGGAGRAGGGGGSYIDLAPGGLYGDAYLATNAVLVAGENAGDGTVTITFLSATADRDRAGGGWAGNQGDRIAPARFGHPVCGTV